MSEARKKLPFDLISLPHFGYDANLVSGFIVQGSPMAARIFIPPRGEDEVTQSLWSDLLGDRLLSTTRWSEYADGDGCWRFNGHEFSHPQGWIGAETANRMADILEVSVKKSKAIIIAAVSGVYAESEMILGGCVRAISPPDCWYNPFTDVTLVANDNLSFFRAMTHENNCHFPVGLWPSDLSWCLASPLYSDSLFLSCSEKLYSTFTDSGLDIFPIRCDTPNPAEGD
ncbi:MAG: hypothetical protein LBK42_05310 [Propionibacteriaceae bacterium]|jgi:hypothetical protein|nr:hypothetical protein [Propionibacteriaceae bacterium]